MFFKKKKRYSFEESMCFLELLSCRNNGRNVFYYPDFVSLANELGYEEGFVQQLLSNHDWIVEVGDSAYRI